MKFYKTRPNQEHIKFAKVSTKVLRKTETFSKPQVRSKHKTAFFSIEMVSFLFVTQRRAVYRKCIKSFNQIKSRYCE